MKQEESAFVPALLRNTSPFTPSFKKKKKKNALRVNWTHYIPYAKYHYTLLQNKDFFFFNIVYCILFSSSPWMIEKGFHSPVKPAFQNLTLPSSPLEARMVPVMFHSTRHTSAWWSVAAITVRASIFPPAAASLNTRTYNRKDTRWEKVFQINSNKTTRN